MSSSRNLATSFVMLPLLVALPASQNPFQLDGRLAMPGLQHEAPATSRPQLQPATPPSNPTEEIPSAYLGCWQGEPRADAWHQYSGPRIEKWVPSTVTLCFVRRPAGVDVTYHKQSLDEAVNQGRIFNARAQTVALGSVGDHIALRSWGSAEQRGHLFGLPVGPKIDIQWMADANVSLLPDSETMSVDESMNQSCSGSRRCTGGPFISAVWHGTLRKVPAL
jgi:hypothetical protein